MLVHSSQLALNRSLNFSVSLCFPLFLFLFSFSFLFNELSISFLFVFIFYSYCSYCPVAQLCLTLCNPTDCSMPGFPVITNTRSLLKLMSIKLVMPSNHLIPHCPLLLLPSIFPSIRVFSKESVLHSKWQSTGTLASATVLPMNIQNWFPLGLTGLILQSKGLLRVQHQSSKASILWCSAFFIVQLSHPYMTTGKP